MKKILFVEDEKFLTGLYKLAFEKTNYELVFIANPKNVLKIAQKEKPDLILLDMVYYKENGELSKEPGFNVLKVLKNNEQTQKIPVIAFTNLSKDDQEEVLKLGAEDFIMKASVTPSDVIKRIKKWIK